METHKVIINANSGVGTSNQNGIITVEPKAYLIGLILSWKANGFKVKRRVNFKQVEYTCDIPEED